jgi:triacylglycerol esterase/lipase EstA (alpha/beta hydrolase family)
LRCFVALLWNPVPLPILLVHGIWDSAAVMGPLKAGLERRGLTRAHAINLPRNGRLPIAELGKLLVEEADALARREAATHIDVVGFSMGALVARWYVQRGGGKERVRRFVSISGPHHGTLGAYALPMRTFAIDDAGLRARSAKRAQSHIALGGITSKSVMWTPAIAVSSEEVQ